MAEVRECSGSIFDSTCQVLVNTVNCEGFMGKGLALEFRRRFPGLLEAYRRVCEGPNRLRPGQLYLYSASSPWVLNFPTKDEWRLPARIEYIELGLAKFAATYRAREIRSIAFPQLGAQSGGLSWTSVRGLMLRALSALPELEVEIYGFDPAWQDRLSKTVIELLAPLGTNELASRLGIRSGEAARLREALASGRLMSLGQLAKWRGIGAKTVDRVYDFGVARTTALSPMTQAEIDWEA